MLFTVEQMLKIGSLQEITVLAGERGLSKRAVKTVVVIDVPHSDQWVRGGEFLITSGFLFADTPYELIDLVGGLARKNAAALGIKIGRFLASVPEEALAKADELDFPILDIPPHVNHTDIINPVLSTIVNTQYELLRETDAIRNRFMESVVSNAEVSLVLEILEEFLHTGAAFVDIALGDLHVSGKSSFQSTSANFSRLRDIMKTLPHEKVILADKLVGALVFEEDPYSLSPLAEVAIKQAKNALFIHLQRKKISLEVERRHKDEFIQNLLYSKFKRNADTLQKARIYGWDPSWELVVAALLPSSLPQKNTQDGIFSQNEQQENYYLCSRHFKILFPGSIGIEYESSYIALVPVKNNESKTDIKNRLEKVRRLLSEGTRQCITIAFSAVKPNLMGASEAFSEVRTTLDVIERMQYRGIALSWEDLGVDRVLSIIKGTETSKSFWKDILGNLVDSSSATSAKHPFLMETLQALIEHDWQPKAVANLLGVHYNTVKYRIKLLEELLGKDLSHGAKKFEVTLAFLLFSADNPIGDKDRCPHPL